MATYNPKDHYYRAHRQPHNVPQIGDLCRGMGSDGGRLWRCVAVGTIVADVYSPMRKVYEKQLAPALKFEFLGRFTHATGFVPAKRLSRKWVPFNEYPLGTPYAYRQPVLPHAVKGLPGWPQ